MAHNLVALLPMKANSNRVPNKNFKSFDGKPLFLWVLGTLLDIPAIEMVVINTDARETLASHGIKETNRILIRDRPIQICGDTVSMNAVIADDIENVPSTNYLMTHTTNPLLAKATIESALHAFEKGVKRGVDSLFTVNRIQSRFYSEDVKAINHDPEKLIPTQELTPWFEENSCLYIFSRGSFSCTQARIGKNPMLFETPELESLDIDTPADWELALAVARHSKNMGSLT